LGDFNALSEMDYSSSYLQKITEVRRNENWELPKFLVTNRLRERYIDCFQKLNQNTQIPKIDQQISTCRFNTRIDYIWISANLAKCIDWEKSSCKILDHKLSDHNAIFATLYFKQPTTQ